MSIAEAIASTSPSDSVAVSGFLALDRSACGRAEPEPNARCSGAFLWEYSLPDPWYGGSRVALTFDDVAKRLGPALGIRDWGVPVVATGSVLEGTCRPERVCAGVFVLQEISWRGEPVPQEFPNDPLRASATVTVGDSRFLVPSGWSTSSSGGRWIVSTPNRELAMVVSKRARQALDAAGSVWETYPEAESITYDYGNALVVWTVELGDSTATRQTVVGYNDGSSEYELTLQWADAGVWAGASQFALRRIVAGMTGKEASVR